MDDLALPRFTGVPDGAGHYESWYLKAAAPDGSRAAWIRYTVHQRPGAKPAGSIWFTFFDSDGGRPQAVKQTAAPGELATSPELFVAIGDLGSFAPGSATGSIAGEGRRAEWELAVADPEPLVTHLADRFYRGGFPRTKLLSVTPSALFSGRLTVGDRTVELDGWPGMIGHNWGREHAERWVWLHGTGFDGHGRDTWIDLALGRVKIGPWTVPWVANGTVSLDGARHRLGGIGKVARTRASAAVGECRFTIPGQGVKVTGRTTAPAGQTVAWRYADPDGSEHHTLNCSLAGLELDLALAGGSTVILETASGAAYEYGSRDTGHGIPVEPFADG